MSDLTTRLAGLNLQQRALLEARIKLRKAVLEAAGIHKRSSADPAILSFAQERLWFLGQLEGPSAAYNICSAIRLRGELMRDFLEQALAGIVNRHESLRSIFPLSAPPPSAQVLERTDFWRDLEDLSSKPRPEKEAALKEVINTIACQRLSLAEGPLFQVHLIRLAPEEHVVVFLMHHIISDGWSFEVFYRELSTLYADMASGRSPSLSPLEIQYADFAQWQRARLGSRQVERQLQYWKGRLAGSAPVLELPTDFPRPSEQSYRGGYQECCVSQELVARLRQLSRETGATLFMTLLAVFKTLLHRYSGQVDILVGSPVTSRSWVELEPMIGFFVNMLVLRTDLSGDPTGRALIHRVRQSTMEDLSCQDVPFEKLVLELNPARSLARAPFFQAAMMFQQEGRETLRLPGLTAEHLAVNTGTAKYDITLYATETQKGLRLGLEFALDLFTARTAERMLAHFEQLLESITTNPDLPISQFNIMGAAESQQLLIDWNQTVADYQREKTIHGLFEEQALRTPDEIAVEFSDRRLTYRELDNRAELLAVELRDLGIPDGALVGLCLDRSLEMIVALLGVLKAGGAYVPLDPTFPKDRLAFMVSNANMPVLVTQQHLVRDLPEHNARVVCVDAVNFARAPRISRSPGSAEDLAYVLYTSGSTGRPKGVQISHRAVVNFLQSMRREPGMTSGDVLLAITTLSFDIAGLELLLPLTTGAKVVVMPSQIAADGLELARVLHETGATIMQATPATWRLLLAAGWKGNPKLKVLSGGEALPPEVARDLLPRCAELWNMYGPTETTIWSSCARITQADDIHIGRPIANTEMYILDAHRHPVPIGVSGELLIGGDGLARGYLNRPDLTAEKFIPHPFKSGARLYCTGDLAKYRYDGNIVCLGRLDFQVKLRGYRIELGEIEAELSRYPHVLQAIVTVHPGPSGEPQLVAYFVPAAGGIVAVDDLRQHLRRELPEYMVPAVYVPMQRLPLTPNGKVDRRALPPPSLDHITLGQAHMAPRTEIEAKMANIWAQVLGVETVGVTDDFFALGGHSLLAVRVFAEIERQMHKKLPIASLFATGTIAGLAAQFDQVESTPSEWSSLVAIQSKGEKHPLYCVHGAGGNVLLYRTLAARLGPDYPLYGFQSRGLDGRARPLSTIEEMADHYLSELKSVRPHGPYCLAGYCLGGMVAYQMARLLRRAGDNVAFVALIDSYNPEKAGQAGRPAMLWQRVRFHAGNILKLRLRELVPYLVEKIRVARDGELSNLLNPERARESSNPGRYVAIGTNDHTSLQRFNDTAAEMFRPLRYDGTVLLYKPRVNYNFLPDPQMGWGDLVTGKLQVVELPVNPHGILMEPFVRHLASDLRQRLDQAGTPL